MNSELKNTEYYLGLDCGTNSVGFAVTDTDYNLLKFNGKTMWGSHLFDEASTAQERRGFRCSRRRRNREVQRLKLLQELFAEEVYKTDPTFFIRLNDSKYVLEDKHYPDKNILFNDPDFKDKDFFKKYPTAYHLRLDLIENGTTDVRFLYLAIHHILKHRGHFLFPGENMSSIVDIKPLIKDLQDSYFAAFESELYVSSPTLFEEAMKLKNRKEKAEKLSNIISTDESKTGSLIVKILLGYKVKTDVLFGNEDYSDFKAIEFKKASFEDEDLPVLEDSLSEDEFKVVQILKAIYDWALFSDVMAGHAYISGAKVDLFENNRMDLKKMKTVIKKYIPDQYNAFFHSKKEGAFSSYIGKNHDSHPSKEFHIKKASVDDFYKEVGALIKKCDQNDADVIYISKAIEESTFMPLLSSYRNGVVPYQVNKIELDKILEKAAEYFSFISKPDTDGLTPAKKISSLLTFRIPYYVGPLGNTGSTPSKYGWVKRKEEEGRILPWNFNEKVDVESSAEQFILRMTNKCTYCRDEDVLPKNSLSYSKYLVLSELNNIRIKGDRLPVPVKQNIFNDLFKTRRKVTIKALVSYLIKEGYFKKSELTADDVTGLESDFKSSLGSFIDFGPYLTDGKLKASDVDLIIKWITIFPEGGSVLKDRISGSFGKVLNAEEISKIAKLKYAGWGRFSHKFLYELQSPNHETGENMSVVSMMWNTDKNLMELMSGEYDFKTQISEPKPIGSLDYGVVDDLYVSPAVKKQIWQTLRIVDEIEKIMKHPPKKVFIETTRSNNSEKKKTKTKSRKADLVDKLKEAIKSGDYSADFKSLLKELEGKTESQVSIQDKLYLYFTQCGKCMYSMKEIEIDDLYKTEIYDVDHIYPYSKTDDDSLKNKVLVLHNENTRKSDTFPISDSIREKMGSFWKMLKDKGFIPREKYDRLTRTTPLSEEDLKGFINRQLVETSQSTKASAEILRQYFGDKSKVVYSKAENVSKFRHIFNIVKCRSLNDLHHAKDAYLNIVVGNVYDTKYTTNFFRAKYGEGYGNVSSETMYKFDVENAWIFGKTGTIQTVKKNVSRNNVLYTKQPEERGGQLFDLQIVPKGSKAGALPSKTTDVQLLKSLSEAGSITEVYDEWTKKYGGYNSLTTSYFALVKSKKKDKYYVTFVPISIVDSKKLSDEEQLKRYCSDILGLSGVEVISKRLLMNSVVEIDGFRFIITGKSSGGKQITLSCSVPLILSDDSQYVLKKIENFSKKLSENKGLIVNPDYDKITTENTLALFDELVSKTKESIYLKRPGNQNEILQSEKARTLFEQLPLNERCSVINEILKYFGMGSGQANLELIGGTKACGTLIKGSRIDLSKSKISVLNQSITGLFEQRINLS